MSRVLDQLILEDVAKNCPEPFIEYNRCIQNPEVTDKRECVQYQQALQKCIKEDVPIFQKIQNNCLIIIKDYEGCLMKNRENYSSKCFDELKALRECSAAQVDKK